MLSQSGKTTSLTLSHTCMPTRTHTFSCPKLQALRDSIHRSTRNLRKRKKTKDESGHCAASWTTTTSKTMMTMTKTKRKWRRKMGSESAVAWGRNSSTSHWLKRHCHCEVAGLSFVRHHRCRRESNITRAKVQRTRRKKKKREGFQHCREFYVLRRVS